MNTTCPHCGSRFDVDDAYLNHQTDCPSCGKFFLISDKKYKLKHISSNTAIKRSAEKKNILLFWIMFPVFYFITIIVLASPANHTWEAAAICAAWILSLAFGARCVIASETGMKKGSEFALYLFLLFLLFPVGIIMVADLRKNCGLSNIMPWAVTTAIIVGLTLLIMIGIFVA